MQGFVRFKAASDKVTPELRFKLCSSKWWRQRRQQKDSRGLDEIVEERKTWTTREVGGIKKRTHLRYGRLFLSSGRSERELYADLGRLFVLNVRDNVGDDAGRCGGPRHRRRGWCRGTLKDANRVTQVTAAEREQKVNEPVIADGRLPPRDGKKTLR
jgi:hypothetical protein